jgi:transcriptional regulator with PAS, ATPase and Fis domain
MQIRARLEALIDEMLDGQIMLDEALAEFEKLYIQKALSRHHEHLSRTAGALGIHRNTLAKRVATYRKQERPRGERPAHTLARTTRAR